MPIICDTCQATFDLEAKAEISAEGETQYFVCPACQQRYDVCRITPEGLRLRRRLLDLQGLLNKRETPKLRGKYTETQVKFRAEVHALSPTYRQPEP